MVRNGKIYSKTMVFLLALIVIFGCMSSAVMADEIDDPLAWMPETLKSSVTSYFPFDGSYEDAMGNIDAQYYNKTTNQSYSVADLAVSGANFVTGWNGKQAIQFGAGAYSAKNGSSNVNLGQVDYTNDFTISFWTNNLFGAEYGSYPVIFGNADWDATDGAAHQGLLVSTLSGGAIIMNLQAGTSGRISPRPAANLRDRNGWHYMTMTGNRTEGKFTLYVDGIVLINGEETNGQTGTGTVGGLYTNSIGKSLQNTAPTRIGSDGYSNYGYYGAVSDFVIFDKCLSAAEVGSLYDSYGYTIPSTIELDRTKAVVYVGNTVQLTATVDPSETPYTWESSDETVATVDGNGLVTAVAAGRAEITAKVSEEIKATATITVPKPKPADGPLLAFPAMSDTHVGVADARFANVLAGFAEINPYYDVITFSGDLTESGTTAQLNKYVELLNAGIVPGAERVITPGNHDGNPGNLATFQNILGMAAFVESKVVNGYTFITYRSSRGNSYGPTAAELTALENYIKASVDADPSKPVFIFSHFPLQDTVFGSETRLNWYDAGSAALKALYEQYPQVILFTGHLHYTSHHPRTVYQDKFTMADTGCSKYIAYGYNGEYIAPASMIQHLYVEVYEDKVVIQPYEFGSGEPEKIGETYIIDLPTDDNAIDPATFRYTPARDTELPKFPENRTYRVLENTSTTATIKFDAATDDIMLTTYKYSVNGGTLRYINLPFWETPATTYKLSLTGLLADRENSITITPIDAYDKEGEPWTITVDTSQQPVDTVDKTALDALIAEAELLDEDDYTAASWADLLTALDEAKAVSSSNESLQSEVDKAAGTLKSAIAALVKKADNPPEIMATVSSNGNGQANIDFAIRSANGKGYAVWICEKYDGAYILANANFNSKGAHVKGLTNGKTYYAYIEYTSNGICEKSNIVTLNPKK